MVVVESTTNWPQLRSVQSTAGETLPGYMEQGAGFHTEGEGPRGH